VSVLLRLGAGPILLDGSAELDLHVGGIPQRPELFGRVALQNADVVFPQAKLPVSRGDLNLRGQMIEVNILAAQEVEPSRGFASLDTSHRPYWVTLALSGNTVDGLQLDLHSAPAVEELALLALLVNGSAPGAPGNDDLFEARTALAFASDQLAQYLLGSANEGMRDVMGETFEMQAGVTNAGVRVGAQQKFLSLADVSVGVEQPWELETSLVSASMRFMFTDALRLETHLLSTLSYADVVGSATSEARVELKYRLWGD
jgi:hypothetical protein